MPRTKKKEEIPLDDPAMEPTEGTGDVANKGNDKMPSEGATELPEVLSNTLADA